ncbi:MAG: hypothetical protein LBI15_01465 [Dysgonamonadaceae bacterium]|jgi:hypothetical protein|nr:hypothetical protein [Dysgonamonadaceae bacterium]
MEQDLRNKFIEYLKKEKLYPDDCFLKEVHIVDNVGQGQKTKILCDLVILDTSNNNYLALVEFKNGIKQLTNDEIFLYQSYIRVLNKPLLSYYFVEPKDNNFILYSLRGNEVSEVDIEDFPNYNTLKSKILADRKTAMESEVIRQKQEMRKKKEVWSISVIGAMISAILGIIVSVFVFNTNYTDRNLGKTEHIIKTLEEQIKKQDLILDTLLIHNVENANILIDSIIYQKYILSYRQLENLDIRVLAIEQLIDQNPKNLMQMQDLNYKIQNLNVLMESSKGNYEDKLANLESRLSTYLIIIFSLTATIFGALVAFAIASLKK